MYDIQQGSRGRAEEQHYLPGGELSTGITYPGGLGAYPPDEPYDADKCEQKRALSPLDVQLRYPTEPVFEISTFHGRNLNKEKSTPVSMQQIYDLTLYK